MILLINIFQDIKVANEFINENIIDANEKNYILAVTVPGLLQKEPKQPINQHL